MAGKLNRAVLSPGTIMEDVSAGWKAQALIAGIELDVFTHIAAGKRAAKDIAKAASAAPRAMSRLLDALVALGYLRKSRDRYSLPPISATFLVRGEKAYMGAVAQVSLLGWDIWKNLTESVKTGKPYHAVDVAEGAKEFFPKLVAAIFPGSFAASQAAVASLPAKERQKIRKILDVAAGSAAWSLAFAQAIPEARVTALDFPEVTPITRKFAGQFGVAARYNYLEGDLRKLPFGKEAFDLIILGHIIHSEGEANGQALLKKCYAALRPGGLLLIAEYIPNDDRTGPMMPVLFGLNMLLHTEQGDVFTMREYRAWLKDTGFRKFATIAAPGPSPLILATK